MNYFRCKNNHYFKRDVSLSRKNGKIGDKRLFLFRRQIYTFLITLLKYANLSLSILKYALIYINVNDKYMYTNVASQNIR